MPQALFYPWIDIRDDAWLKSSLLYWDSVRTIVPESIDTPYSTDVGRALKAAGFLVPLRVHSGMHEIEDLAEDVISYLGTTEGAELLIDEHAGRGYYIHVEKLPHRLGRLAEIHPEKLPYEIRHILQNHASPSDREKEWLRVDDGFANFYMTLLANRLSERVGARLLTSIPAADRLAVTARHDAQLNGLIPWGMRGSARRWREYEAFGPRRHMPRSLAQGMLASLAIERVAVAADTSIDKLIDFRERHRDELALFRAKVDQLVASVDADLPAEALRQRIADLHASEVAPAISNLKEALSGRRIRWISEGLRQIAYLSVGSSSMLVLAGLAVPTALLAGAGIGLIVSRVIYNVERRESLRANPYTYLLSAGRELS
jgi:hypothetical protein